MALKTTLFSLDDVGKVTDQGNSFRKIQGISERI